MTRIAENAILFCNRRRATPEEAAVNPSIERDAAIPMEPPSIRKKDALVNIGGLAVNDHEVFEEASNLVVVYEGLHMPMEDWQAL